MQNPGFGFRFRVYIVNDNVKKIFDFTKLYSKQTGQVLLSLLLSAWFTVRVSVILGHEAVM